jgi:pilus assembly protein CpaF
MATLKEQVAGWGFSPLSKTKSPLDEATDTATADNIDTSEAVSVNASVVRDRVDEASLNAMSSSYYSKKTKLHQKLISRLELSSIESMPPEQLRGQLKDLVTALIAEDALAINGQERLAIITDLQNEILGLGPLEPLLADPTISEIMVNAYDTVFVERRGRLELTNIRFGDNAHLMKIIDKIVSRVGRRIDESSPMADARLPDGSRVNAIIPPLALDGPSLTIRRFSVVPLEMQDLIEKASLTQEMAELLAGMVKAKVNILISGGTGSGKTTLLNILSRYIPEDERIVTIEDTAELQLQQRHVVRLETRPPNIEGIGEVSMRTLVKNSLRMRPNRIVVGEVRGEEVIDMLQAMNTGHDGSLTTVHANTPRDALGRLDNLMSMGGLNMTARSQRQQICSAINVIIQVNRMSDGSRKITSVSELSGMEGEVITMQEIFKFEQANVGAGGEVEGRHQATGVRPKIIDRLQTSGVILREDIFNPSQRASDNNG